MRALKSVFVVTTSCTMVPNKKYIYEFRETPSEIINPTLLPVFRLIIMTLIITTSHRNREEYYFICYILAVVFQKNT